MPRRKPQLMGSWRPALAQPAQSSGQISDLPKSLSSKSYDIEAKPAQRASREKMMKMLQRLIEDRFKLRPRHESKERSAYVLTVAKPIPTNPAKEMKRCGISSRTRWCLTCPARRVKF